MPTKDGQVGGDIREYLRVLRRRMLVVVGVTVAVAFAALGYSMAQTPMYTASADVLVPQTNALTQAAGQANAQLNSQYLARNLDNAKQFATSDSVKAGARAKLGYDPSVSVSASSDADLLAFRAHSADKRRAAAIVNAYVDSYIETDHKQQLDHYVSQANVLHDRIASLQQQQSDAKPASPDFISLGQQIATLQQTQATLQAAAQISDSSGAQILHRAKPPTRPSSPRKLRNTALGLGVGVLLGMGLAFLVDRMDDSIKSKLDIDEISNGIPLVGLIPEVPGWRDREDAHVITLESPQSVASEAYRTLRTSVQFLGIERPLRVVGITSPNPGEGKTTTLANLAVSAANAGLQVVVVCCDLRRPRIHTFFGMSNEVGLTSVLLGETSLDDALQHVEGQPRLRLLASGPIPPNPAELLNVSRVEQVLQSLARGADLVLIDCPPVIPVTDSLLISRMVDGMLVVGHARRTHKRELQRTLELFAQVDAPVVGSVLNAVPSGRGYGYGYGYGYAYTYGGDADEGRRARRRARRQAFERVVDETAREDLPLDLH